MTLVANLLTLVTDVATQFKNVKTAITGSPTSLSLSGLTTTDKDSLIDAINEVNAASGGSVNLDALTDVVITAAATGDILRYNGTNWVDALGTTHFDAAGSAAAAQAAAIAASQPLDSDLTSIAALTTTSYGRAFLALANQAATMALLSAGTESAQGILELATTGEATTGTDTARAVTPAGVKAAIDALIASAPGALDTLDELAAALGDDANFAATMTTALAGKQPLDASLTALAALTTAANKFIYFTGADTPVAGDITAAGRALLDDADAAAQCTTLDIGSTTTDFAAAFAAALT